MKVFPCERLLKKKLLKFEGFGLFFSYGWLSESLGCWSALKPTSATAEVYSGRKWSPWKVL